MSRARILAFAQLVRIPNVFTAFADIALGACVAVAFTSSFPPIAFWAQFILLLLASGSLYLSGMVWNDVFDRSEDAQDRPFRPIPSGRVSMRTALMLGIVLMVLGVGFAGLSGLPAGAEWHYEALGIAIVLVISIFLYDAWLKHTFVGPIAMGWCRTANVALGLTLAGAFLTGTEPIVLRLLPLVVGVYIVAVTVLAKNEAQRSRRWVLVLAMFLFLVALILALVVRAWLPSGYGTVVFPYILVAFGFGIGIPIINAYRKPGPREVQRAVKRCILGLVVFDAILATAFIGLPGLLVLLLLPPALLLGKWVYST
jgi:heme O synthase-like polyprenyltransferase